MKVRRVGKEFVLDSAHEVERGRPHYCVVCGLRVCDCGENSDCYCCKKCRRISVDLMHVDRGDFTLLADENEPIFSVKHESGENIV